MNWFYVDAGKQAGPVDDAGLAALVATGKIANETLVWREGMANWQAYGEVKPGGLRIAGAPAAAGGIGGEEAVCAECGQLFPVSDTIRIGEARVCANCKPVFVQKMREGVSERFATGAYVTEEQVLAREYRVDIGSAFNRSWQTFSANAGVMIGSLLVAGVVFVICTLLTMLVAAIIPMANVPLSLLFSVPIIAGVALLSLRLVRGETAGVGDVFAGFTTNYWRLIGLGGVQLLVNLICVLPLVVFGIVAGFSVVLRQRGQVPDMAAGMVIGLFMGGFLCLCCLCWADTLLTYTLLLIADKGYRIWPAMQLSWRMVRRRWWMTFLFLLVGRVIYGLGCLMCLVGVLVSAPIYCNMKSILYDDNFRDLMPQR